jgi:hypothetical protein
MKQANLKIEDMVRSMDQRSLSPRVSAGERYKRALPEFEFFPKQQIEERLTHLEMPNQQRNYNDLRKAGTTESTYKSQMHDTLEFKTHISEVEKRMREMEERI